MFDLVIPTALPGVDTHILDPRNTYGSPEQWREKAETLAKLFIENFEKYTDTPAGEALVSADRSCGKAKGNESCLLMVSPSPRGRGPG